MQTELVKHFQLQLQAVQAHSQVFYDQIGEPVPISDKTWVILQI